MPQDKNHFEGWDRIHVNATESYALADWLKGHFFFSNHDFKDGEVWFVIAQSAQSGVGITTFVKCLECNAEKDITDYGIW